jgi:hypothetical protein
MNFIGWKVWSRLSAWAEKLECGDILSTQDADKSTNSSSLYAVCAHILAQLPPYPTLKHDLFVPSQYSLDTYIIVK